VSTPSDARSPDTTAPPIYTADMADGDDPGRAHGGPVLVAYVNDSDCATVQGRTPDGAAWSGALDAEVAAGYESPFGWETDLSVVIPAAVA